MNFNKLFLSLKGVWKFRETKFSRGQTIPVILLAIVAGASLCYVSKTALDKHYRKGSRKEFLVLHSTNNPHKWGNAANNAKYLSWSRHAGAHVVIDDKERWQTADFSWGIPAVGGRNWTGFIPKPWLKDKITNANSISWEMCLGWGRDNTKIVEQTAAEMGFYLVTYGLEIGAITRHNEAKGKYCPFFGQLYMNESEWDEFYKDPAGSGYWDQSTEDVLFWKYKLRVEWYHWANLLRLGKVSPEEYEAKMNEPSMLKWGSKSWTWGDYPIKGIERPYEDKHLESEVE